MNRSRIGTQQVAILVAAVALLAGGILAVTAGRAGAMTAEVNPAPASGVWTVDGRGNGHGHGLSQYGAQGAAIAGLSASKIVAFYYPGTVLSSVGASAIRVQITDQGSYTTVRAASGLSLSGVGALTGTASRWQVRPNGTLWRDTSGWHQVRSGLPATATFSSSTGVVRLFHADGSSTDYRGTISAIRSGSGEITVNRLALDDYVRGVIPREMPASWRPAAVQSQAIAARSYARYVVQHSGGGAYDICDSPNCQVYGGKMNYNGSGGAIYGEDARTNDAVAKTANKVLTYHGATVFAQFSASNGGVMAAGGQPYLVGKADPYDNAASGDPYLGWTRSVSVSQVAGQYGLAKVTEIDITGRAGGGAWGGVVTTATVRGTSSGGQAKAVPTTGAGLASAMGLPYQLFHLRSTGPVGHVDSVTVETAHSYRIKGWTYDPAKSGVSTRVHVYVDRGGHSFPANLSRPDVKTKLHTATAAHGFSVVVNVPLTGTHRLCVYGMDAAGKHHTTLNCRSISAPSSAIGHVETVTRSGTSYQVTGWAFDPNRQGGPGRVHVYVDRSGYPFNTSGARPDVMRHYGLRSSNVGFVVTVPVPAGTHRICTYAINTTGAGANTRIRCVTVKR